MPAPHPWFLVCDVRLPSNKSTLHTNNVRFPLPSSILHAAFPLVFKLMQAMNFTPSSDFFVETGSSIFKFVEFWNRTRPSYQAKGNSAASDRASINNSHHLRLTLLTHLYPASLESRSWEPHRIPYHQFTPPLVGVGALCPAPPPRGVRRAKHGGLTGTGTSGRGRTGAGLGVGRDRYQVAPVSVQVGAHTGGRSPSGGPAVSYRQ